MLDYAHSLIQIKSFDDEQRVVEGIASTPTADRTGDVMEPAGAKFTLPMPLLWQHQHDKPIGHVLSARVTDAGILVRAQLAKGIPFVDEAWSLIKARLVGGLSIGWRPLEAPERIQKNGQTVGLRFKSWEWLELSAVTIGMNAQTTILQIKTIDAADRAALGTRPHVSTPGASGTQSQKPMTISEQLASERADLQTKSARLTELTNPDGDLSAEDMAERDTLTADVSAGAQRMKRLEALEAAQSHLAQTVSYSPRPASQTAKTIEVVNLPKGTRFARYAMAVAAGKGSYSDTLAYAKRWDGQTPEVSRYIKAVAGTTDGGSPGWGAELYNPNAMVVEFVELLNAQSIIGRTPGLRTVPVGIPVVTQTGGSTFQWVGETGSKPVGQLSFDRTTTARHKVAGIIVLSEELVRYGRPDAEGVVRRDLVEQCALFLDAAFIQIAKTAGANNPASITNGVTSPAASGTTLADLLYDLNVALATFDTGNIGSDGLVIATTPALARGISMLTNPLGQSPNGFAMTPSGGTLLGYPVIVSASVDAGTIVIFKPSEILLSGGDAVQLDASNQATLDMDGGSPATATFSLWQNNCVGIRAEQFITWMKRRSGVVAIIDTASYGPSVGSP